jgi:hypothetical protein
MEKALTAPCAVTILVALSAQDASAAAPAAEQPVEAPGEATDEMREAMKSTGLGRRSRPAAVRRGPSRGAALDRRSLRSEQCGS